MSSLEEDNRILLEAVKAIDASYALAEDSILKAYEAIGLITKASGGGAVPASLIDIINLVGTHPRVSKSGQAMLLQGKERLKFFVATMGYGE